MNKYCLLICDEYFNDNAGTHRQRRWAENYFIFFDKLFVFHKTSLINTSITKIYKGKYYNKSGVLKSTASTNIFHKILRFFKHYFLLEFILPNFIVFYFKLVFFILFRKGSFYIHVSSPPFPFVFYTTILLKKLLFFKKIYIHVDMRDPWALHKSLGGCIKIKKYLEKKALSRADMLTTVSKFLSKQFSSEYGINCEVVYNVATHISEFNNSELDLNKKTIKIVYTGTIPYNFYDLETLATLISKVDLENSINFEWYFIGECELLKNELISSSAIMKNVFFLPRQNHDDLLAILRETDIVLFFGHKFPGYLTTKLFEYFSANKYILPLLVPQDSEASQLIKTICNSCPEISNISELNYFLNNFKKLPKAVNTDILLGFKYKYKIIIEKFYALNYD